MKRHSKIGLLLLSLFLMHQAGFAQPSDDELRRQEEFLQKQEHSIAAKESIEEQRKRTQAPMERLRKESSGLKKIDLPQESPSFYIRTIQLRGAYADKFLWVQKYLQQYQNQKIGIQGINLVTKQINEALVDKGYVTTRVYVKEQDISTGTLFVDLAAGTLGEIRFSDPAVPGTWKNAFSARPGDLLNIRDLEQGLEQMKRVPSQDVAIKIEPAAIAGQSNIVLTVTRKKPWKLITSLDDSGTESTGKLQGTASLELDNLFAVNDIINISVNQDAVRDGEIKGTRASSFYYSIPSGKDTLTFSGSRYSYHQTVRTAVVPFLQSGETGNLQFTVTHLLSRDQTRKTNMEVGLIKKSRRSFIDDTEVTVQRQDTTALRLGLTQRQYVGNTVLDAAVRYQKGIPCLGARDGVTDHVPGQASTRYQMLLADFAMDSPLQIGHLKSSYNLHIRGQRTDDLTYGSEFFSIGGRYTVRGFDGEQTLSAENGLTVQNEIRLPVNKNNQLYLAIDYGKIQGPSAEAALGKELWGSAVGIRGNLKKIQYDAFIGWPLKKPDGFQTSKQACGFQILMEL
ncbi:ShlB/FhaC/HecB family hemolysin secretion/activation protein [Propionispora hippei]|uniref:Hemolysin activation/secretion protein n=1 Tax=Propionispora hippei DSM 15287 TaxID=1123003 RepID=A0A1M6EE78_9FIRM|nr:ShlB/FhaC/HecB family hemolysin secretion/activation protein [Propionispora hippei]SHI83608.1 hemolysin activation/secretion protein [Propionispora hippei DSM 15287]